MININGINSEVIDFHVHTFPDAIADRAVAKLERISGLAASTNGTIASTIKAMDNGGIDRAVLLNIATTPLQQETINNCANDINQEYKDRLIAFGSVHFDNESCIAELDRIAAMGIKGIKLHPDYQEFVIDDEKLFPIYEKCQEICMPIVFHAGWDCYSPNFIHAMPKNSANVIAQFPKLKVILAHLGGLKCWDDVERYLVGKEVYFDTSMCMTYADKKQVERILKSHSEEHLLFGSDCPWENPESSAKYLLSLDLSDSLKRKILSGNAKRLLAL